ncbi:hypothetical protein Taro_013170 [Colocasia esculenta]|uniref:FAF domain-containing protein n=1 Tax=Colocasia esculenta TaxID=4460 RepID=A0A843UET0_COLES|nr:hypothetical protein [Colocasia esculenta]
MAACGSLRHLFERPRHENPTLMESLSWSQINAAKHARDTSSAAASFTEIFGELHFDERRPAACPAQPAPPPDRCPSPGGAPEKDGCGEEQGACFLHPSSGSPMGGQGNSGPEENGVVPRMRRSESLRLCTEGLGSESSDVVEDPKGGPGGNWIGHGGGAARVTKRRYSRTLSEVRPRARGEFPPPISCIGSGGRPWVSFRSYREGGRFVLREVKIPTQELLSASREGGRLMLRFVQRDEEAEEEEEGEEEEEEEEEEAGRDEEGYGVSD